MNLEQTLCAKTPLVEMYSHEPMDHRVFFKMEAYHPCGSFKLRGMEYACRQAVKRGAKMLISSSGCNAGLAVAYSGMKLGVPVTVLIPETSGEDVIAKLRAYQANVVLFGTEWEQADQRAKAMEKEDPSCAYIHPHDMADVWTGHAAIIDELKEQCEEQPDLICCSVGGGGLLNGLIEGLERNRWNDTSILAIEPRGTESFYKAVEAGSLVEMETLTSIAHSLGAKKVCAKSLENAKTKKIIPYLVEDRDAINACKTM